MAEEKDIEARAKEMGWSPKEDFRGDPERWIDAETFVERGETFVPFLKATTKKQEAELSSLREETQKLKSIVQANQETIEALKEFNTASARKAAEGQRQSLMAKIREAREAGDVETEETLRAELGETNAAIKESKAEKPKAEAEKPVQKDWTQSPEWKEWHSENEWFGKDKRRSALAIGIGQEIRESPEGRDLPMREFLDRVVEELEKTLPSNSRREKPSKVAGGSRNGSGEGDSGGSGKRSYSDLPSDAKTACNDMAARFVGEGRAYKNIAEWREAYASRYDWE